MTRYSELEMQFETLIIDTPGRGLISITPRVEKALAHFESGSGLLTLWILHTSASLIVTENTDSDVLRDHEAFLGKLVPDGTLPYHHSDEGADDMPAHIRSILTQTSLTIPVRNGRMTLGTWQGIFLWEHRTMPHRRRIQLAWLNSGS